MERTKLNKKCRKIVSKAKINFSKNFISNLKNVDPKNWMKSMKKLGKSSFEPDTSKWKFVDEVGDDQTLTNEMAAYFSNISKNFTPVNRSLLPVLPPGSDFVSEVNCYPQEHE